MSINAYPHSRKTRQMNDTTRDELLRVEPHSRRVAGRMPVNGELSLGAGAGALWALQEGSPRGGFELHGPLLRIDPNTNRVTARIALRTPEGQPFAGFEVLADRDDVWVGGAGGALRVDPRTNRVMQAVAAPDELISSDFALARRGLWAITEDGRLLRFDTRTGTVIGDVRLAVTDALDLSRGPADTLPAALPEGLARIEPDTGRVITRLELDDFGGTGIAAIDHELWLSTVGGDIVILRR
jgi:hypothetical protein